MKKWIFHMINFGIVGATGMVIDFGITWILREKASMNEYLANAIGFIFAVINNYLLNKYWTYGETGFISLKQLLSFVIISSIGLSLNSIWLYVLSKGLKVKFYWAKLLATAFVFVWNFIINNYITFN